ncbi:PH-domain-containing protein [Backusella circina FSU 941]|nr:PH-domain-containing protein [Backusella circina FSU 941]
MNTFGISTTPRSGWLSKLSKSNAFGSARWQSRYFVLLDSEMRYYKDEHSTNASRTISLKDIAKVSVLSTQDNPFCFQLEPTALYLSQVASKYMKKIWTIRCQSEYELEAWVDSIHFRLSKIYVNDYSMPPPLLQPFSTPEQRRVKPLASMMNEIQNPKKSEIEKIEETGHLLDQNTLSRPIPQPRLLKSRTTISRRRGVILSPLELEMHPILDDTVSSCSTESSKSTLSSPASITYEENVQANKLMTKEAYLLNTSSPTFELYKERFSA